MNEKWGVPGKNILVITEADKDDTDALGHAFYVRGVGPIWEAFMWTWLEGRRITQDKLPGPGYLVVFANEPDVVEMKDVWANHYRSRVEYESDLVGASND